MSKIEILKLVIPFITFIGGYYLGKKERKKQFILSHFDLHEKLLKKINNMLKDEFAGYYFAKPDKEIKTEPREHDFLSYVAYCRKLKENPFFNETKMNSPLHLYLMFEPIVGIVKSFRELSVRSNRSVSKIIKKILKIYDNKIEILNSELGVLDESCNSEEGYHHITERESKYRDYLTNEIYQKILLQIIPLIKKLKKELKKYLNNKE